MTRGGSIPTILTIDVETWQPLPPGYHLKWNENVIQPLIRIEGLLRKYNHRAVLMIETQELIWLLENDPVNFSKIIKQLDSMSDIVEFGLHVHAAWDGAVPAPKDRVEFGPYQYLLDAPDPYKLLRDGYNFLVEEFDVEARAYRGARYQLTEKGTKDWSKTFDMLKRLGIKVDTSVWPGAFRPEYGIDYRGAPVAPYYPDKKDITKAGPQRSIKEYPISVVDDIKLELGAINRIFMAKNAMDKFKVLLGHTKGLIDWTNLELLMINDAFYTFKDYEDY